MDLITKDHINTENDFFSLNHEWTWDENFLNSWLIQLSDNDLNVTFFPSSTAFVKGNKPLEKGRHHYWEILMLTEIYGIDVMVGVGTANAELHEVSKWRSCALLGRDRESWGFSYKGYLQHNSKKYKYGREFGQDDLIGIHLDTWTGTLQFFINRKPLGVAFTKLNNVTLYPLISSTINCVMRLTCSCSTPVSLQTACLTVLSPSQKAYLSKKFLDLRYLIQDTFADTLQKSIDCDNEEEIIDIKETIDRIFNRAKYY